ncbi:MAG: DUF480 domain-containing protein [Thermoleophilia bacterium]|nr:DUF480 domain-containing protein [Thermoleophilia bacterium]
MSDTHDAPTATSHGADATAPAGALLDVTEARILGCLIEKERTTPAEYPLTANALMRACNQSTSRQPVVAFEERIVDAALGAMKGRGLVRFVHSQSNRATKYRHVADEGLALDPEWRMRPGEVPGRVIGQVDAEEVNRVAGWMAQMVKRRNLPDKILLVHQFEDGMIERRARLRPHRGIDFVLNADGFGTASAKTGTYRRVTRGDHGFATGFKLFYEEDTGLMTPGQVLRLSPRPDVVIYE